MTCECGCGQTTRIAPKNDASKGWVKGQPLRYARGHNARVTNRPRRTTVGPDDWNVEDRGFETPCWIWKGAATDRYGHRKVGIDGHYESAHAAVYRRLVGPIPAGHHLHHRCEEPACVRPDHLLPLLPGAHTSLHKRKLTDADIREIRRCTDVPLRDLARRFGISRPYASSVRTGRERQDVAA